MPPEQSGAAQPGMKGRCQKEMDDDFEISDRLYLPATLDTRFNVGFYQVDINNVVLSGVATISVVNEYDFRRLLCYDREGNFIAFINAHHDQHFEIYASKIPRFGIYHLSIKLK